MAAPQHSEFFPSPSERLMVVADELREKRHQLPRAGDPDIAAIREVAIGLDTTQLLIRDLLQEVRDHAGIAASTAATVVELQRQIQHLQNVVTHGNGTKSGLVTQIELLARRCQTLEDWRADLRRREDKVAEREQQLRGVKTTETMRVRWGFVTALVAAAAAAAFAWLREHMK